MIVYGIPPKKVPYGIDIDKATEKMIEAQKDKNQELLVVDSRNDSRVEGCITIQMLLNPHIKNTYQLTWGDMENVEIAYRDNLTRDKILDKILEVTSKKRSLFVLKGGTKQGRLQKWLNYLFLPPIYFRNIEFEITDELALITKHKEKQPNYPEPNYPNLIKYNI